MGLNISVTVLLSRDDIKVTKKPEVDIPCLFRRVYTRKALAFRRLCIIRIFFFELEQRPFKVYRRPLPGPPTRASTGLQCSHSGHLSEMFSSYSAVRPSPLALQH